MFADKGTNYFERIKNNEMKNEELRMKNYVLILKYSSFFIFNFVHLHRYGREKVIQRAVSFADVYVFA